mgnify:FL=1
MKTIARKLPVFIVAFIMAFLSGCSYMVKHPMETSQPKVATETESGERLKQLPKPKNKVVAAVYNFRDKTGQYKMSSGGGGSWSTAVTQGATSVLIQAMERSGWFIPIERGGLGNLLNERKIIRSSRSHYSGGNNNNSGLPPLMFAGVILEGGIISYDHNIKTGGAGLRYFGAGASGEYRQDRVSVYLRAVSTKNGKILKSVNATKTVLSQKIDAGIFRYVKFKRLLEAETGVTFNEPTQLAVRSAIEKALESLIIEGIFEDLWQLQNPEEINSEVVQSYIKEKDNRAKTDMFGMLHQPRPYTYAVRLDGGITKYAGDYTSSLNRPLLNASFGYQLTPKAMPYIQLGKSYLAAKPHYNSAYSHLNLGMRYHFTPKKVYTPFVLAEFGSYTETGTSYEQMLPKKFSIDNLFYYTAIGGGFEYYLDPKRRVGLGATVKFNYFFSDELDGVVHGTYNDFYWEGNLGVSFYF